ncbi:zinc-ribbon and DUF3426 domain-containing protein [Alkanindiges sp. WGS2144]|uniref:zinc-ribbon and DUF3426 domain-containing protein n=1 Tax=Alkanindiges sp. WGS2144 TaxID=3366808 RepID=UPI003751C670
MTVKQTRCPFCQSAFYITSLQLNAYRGQARCGQCHQIFDANSNLVVASAAQTQPDTRRELSEREPSEMAPAPASPAPAVEEPLLFSDDVGLPETSISGESRTFNTTAAPASTQPPMLFSDDNGLPDDEPATPISANKNKDNLVAAPVILDDTFDQQFLNDTFADIDLLSQQELGNVEKLHAAADDSWLDDLLAEDEQPPAAAQQLTAPADIAVPQVPADERVKGMLNHSLPEALTQRNTPAHDEDLLSFLNRTGAVSIPASPSVKASAIPASRPASHRILKPTPVKSNPAYFIGWGLMSLLMLALLVAQYIYFNFESMAMNPKTSGYITRLCSVTGCQIPYMNADELQVKNIRLTAHKHLGQTTFKAQLINQARLSQPFPALRLNLKRQDKTVASQIIQPRQYLPENLKSLTRLATKTPYTVEFTIKTRRSDIKDFSLEPLYH